MWRVYVCVMSPGPVLSSQKQTDIISSLHIHGQNKLLPWLQSVLMPYKHVPPTLSLTSMFPHKQTPVRKHIPLATQGNKSTPKHNKGQNYLQAQIVQGKLTHSFKRVNRIHCLIVLFKQRIAIHPCQKINVINKLKGVRPRNILSVTRSTWPHFHLLDE